MYIYKFFSPLLSSQFDGSVDVIESISKILLNVRVLDESTEPSEGEDIMCTLSVFSTKEWNH